MLAILPNQGPASSETPKPVAKKGDGKGRAPAAVTAATVMASDMPVILVAPGTVEPLANVAVKTRVDGQIVEVLFKEGDPVNKGDVLFRLDDRMVKAQISQAEAGIAKDQASLRDAEATLGRREALVGKKIVTEAAADQALCGGGPQGQHRLRPGAAGDAKDPARLSHHPRADHRPAGCHLKVGAMVRGVDAPARYIVIKPDQADLGDVCRAAAGRFATARPPGAGCDVAPRWRQGRRCAGPLGLVDNQVDKQTGTITAKVIAENNDEVLWPGLSAEVALTVEMKRNMLAVPLAAVLPAQQGMITWVIGPDNRLPRVP